MDDPKALFDQVAQDLVARHTDAKQSKMFGAPNLTVNKKAFACFSHGAMIFKLVGKSHARALALEGAHLWDPGGMGRPMKEWVYVPVAHAAQWAEFAEDALEYVRPN